MREQLRLPILDDEGPQTQIWCGDILTWAQQYAGTPMHAMLCDPPYSLGDGNKGFMNAKWDTNIAFKPETWKALAQHLLPGAFIIAFAGARTYHRLACALEDAGLILHPCIGFVTGQGFPKATRIDTQVDQRGGKLPSRLEFARYLKCKKEEKGYTRDDINEMLGNRNSNLWSHWTNDNTVQPSLPTFDQFQILEKALEIDQRWREWFVQESEREVIGSIYDSGKRQVAILPIEAHDYNLTAPATPLAQAWAGHRYGLQALKPALELIAVAQKPYSTKPVESITQTGAGALNIDGGRIANPTGESAGGGWDYAGRGNRVTYDGRWRDQDGAFNGTEQHPAGRWPPNFALVHDSRCGLVGERQVNGTNPIGPNPGHLGYHGSKQSNPSYDYTDATGHETVPAYECHPECPVFLLDQQAGVRRSSYPGNAAAAAAYVGTPVHIRDTPDIYHYGIGTTAGLAYADTGAASRFFHVSDFSLDVAEQLAQAAPAHYSEKSSPKERDLGLLGQLPCLSAEQPDVIHDGDPVHTTRHYRIDAQRQPILDNHGEIAWSRCRRNGHPTVKPLALNRWLATLLLPPAAYAPRRLLVPFAGSGSEMIGAMLAGWDEVLGIDSDPEYVEISRARIAYWSKHAHHE